MENLAQAESWLLRHTSYGGGGRSTTRRSDLEPIVTMLAGAGRPHGRYPVIQVVGTRGKGTTATFISQLLLARGFKVGLFCSPHLVRLSERISVDGVEIGGETFAYLLDEVLQLPLAMTASFFDLITSVAALHFAREGVDVAVVEAGRGGITDSSTALDPKLLVFTNVGRDHMESLGATPEERARVKAGAIRPGAIMISALPLGTPVWTVANGIARTRGAKPFFLGRDFFFRGVEWGPGERQVELDFRVGAGGPVQAKARIRSCARFMDTNAALALATLVSLGENIPGLAAGAQELSPPPLLEPPPGRFQVARMDPPLVLDGAQSPEAIRAVLESWRNNFPRSGPPRVLLALGRDKDGPAFMQALAAGGVRELFVLQVDSERGLEGEALVELARLVGMDGQVVAEGVSAGWDLLDRKDGPWLVTGSLYLVGELHRLAADPG